MSPRTFVKDTHRIGFRKALVEFNRRRHLLPALAYILLAFAIGLAFQQERVHSNQNRTTLAVETHAVLIQGCERQNVLRATLRELVSRNVREARRLGREGTLTQVQVGRSLKETHLALRKLAPTNCQAVYKLPKSSKPGD